VLTTSGGVKPLNLNNHQVPFQKGKEIALSSAYWLTSIFIGCLENSFLSVLSSLFLPTLMRLWVTIALVVDYGHSQIMKRLPLV
jgi:hypothetical protein